MNDADPAVAKEWRKRIAALSGSQRVIMACRMFHAGRAMVLASFPPGLSERERKALLFERLYGKDFNEEEKKKILEHLKHCAKSES